jgi:flavin-dependent dehydrogenase
VAFGLESEIPVRVEPGLHFHFVPEIRDGYAWAFPCGAGTRFGVLSYRGRTKLLPALERFMARFDARPGSLHGGYLATGWTAGVEGEVFVAGDAAGQCLPLSGEGIRTAALAGARCGELVQQVLDGAVTLEAARAAYRAFIGADRRRYRALLWGNLMVLGAPQRWLGRGAALLTRPSARRWFFRHYLGIMNVCDQRVVGIAAAVRGRVT